MFKAKDSKIGLLCLYILGFMGCSQADERLIETPASMQQDFISIESRSCNRITAILPGRGRYDGISLAYLPKIKQWQLKFEHVPYRNEKPSPIGLLSLEEIADIASKSPG